jgi:hypothetical protein
MYPEWESIDGAMGVYLEIKKETGEQVFTEESPITMLRFVLTDEPMEMAQFIGEKTKKVLEIIEQMRQETREMRKFVDELKERSSLDLCQVCGCTFVKVPSWQGLCGRHMGD